MSQLGPNYFLDLFEKKIITREQCVECIKKIAQNLQRQLFDVETVLAVIQTENLFKMQVEDEQGKPDLVDYEAVCSHVKSE